MFMMVVGKMIIIIIKITRGREGAFNNYVDQFLPNFDPTPKVIHTKYSKHRPSTVAHTFECVCSKKESWFKSWVIHFTFEAYTLPHTLNCIPYSQSRALTRLG